MSKPKVLVIGDVIIDEWIYGSVNRISPEAPVPVLDVECSSKNLGGAGNVIVNLKFIGADPILITGISEEENGHLLKKMIRDICGEDQFYFNIPESFKKKRICSGQQQIVRIDTGNGKDIGNAEVDEYFNRLKGKVDIVLIADYGKGAVTEYLLKKASQFCKQEGIKLIIDPYQKSYYNSIFTCDMVKLNRKEAEWFSGVKYKDEEDINKIGRYLMTMFNSKSVLLTLGPKGIAYFDRKKYVSEPYRRIDNPLKVFDVSGAGDVVFSVVGYLLANKYSIEGMLECALKAGKMAVSKKGTSVINREELFGE